MPSETDAHYQRRAPLHDPTGVRSQGFDRRDARRRNSHNSESTDRRDRQYERPSHRRDHDRPRARADNQDRRRPNSPASSTFSRERAKTTNIEFLRELATQVDFYFSDSNLPFDDWLTHTLEENGGWLSITSLMKFDQIARRSKSLDLVKQSISYCSIVEANRSTTWLRRKYSAGPVPSKIEVISRSIFAKGFPDSVSRAAIKDVLESHGHTIRGIRFVKKSVGDVYAECGSPEQARQLASEQFYFRRHVIETGMRCDYHGKSVKLRLLVYARQIGAIIGVKGETVKNIRRSCNTNVRFSGRVVGVKRGVVTVEGFCDGVIRSCQMIADKIVARSGNSMVKILVECSHCHEVMLKIPRAERKAKISLSNDTLHQSTEKTITISGCRSDVSHSIAVVVSQLAKNPCHADVVEPFDPASEVARDDERDILPNGVSFNPVTRDSEIRNPDKIGNDDANEPGAQLNHLLTFDFDSRDSYDSQSSHGKGSYHHSSRHEQRLQGGRAEASTHAMYPGIPRGGLYTQQAAKEKANYSDPRIPKKQRGTSHSRLFASTDKHDLTPNDTLPSKPEKVLDDYQLNRDQIENEQDLGKGQEKNVILPAQNNSKKIANQVKRPSNSKRANAMNRSGAPVNSPAKSTKSSAEIVSQPGAQPLMGAAEMQEGDSGPPPPPVPPPVPDAAPSRSTVIKPASGKKKDTSPDLGSCDLCDVHYTSEAVKQSHLSGKKHAKNLKKYAQKKGQSTKQPPAPSSCAPSLPSNSSSPKPRREGETEVVTLKQPKKVANGGSNNAAASSHSLKSTKKKANKKRLNQPHQPLTIVDPGVESKRFTAQRPGEASPVKADPSPKIGDNRKKDSGKTEAKPLSNSKQLTTVKTLSGTVSHPPVAQDRGVPPNHVQLPSSAFAPSSAPIGVQSPPPAWEWEDDNGIFQPYDLDKSKALNHTLVGSSIFLRIGTNMYEFSKTSSTTGIQTNTLTKYKRRIRVQSFVSAPSAPPMPPAPSASPDISAVENKSPETVDEWEWHRSEMRFIKYAPPVNISINKLGYGESCKVRHGGVTYLVRRLNEHHGWQEHVTSKTRTNIRKCSIGASFDNLSWFDTLLRDQGVDLYHVKNKCWYEGRIMATRNTSHEKLCKVHYRGYSSWWDEEIPSALCCRLAPFGTYTVQEHLFSIPQWSWQNDGGDFVPYPAKIQKQLDSAMIAEYTCKNNKQMYRVYPTYQINQATGTRRLVKKTVVQSGPRETIDNVDTNVLSMMRLDDMNGFPSFWNDSMVSSHLRVLSADDALFSHIGDEFFKSVSRRQFQIVGVATVENPRLLRLYQGYRQSVRDFVPNLNERFLWHGTSGVSSKSIVQTGFNRDYARVMAYGMGVYFALNAQYSVNERYSSSDEAGIKYMFWCLVLCGSSVLGKKSMRGVGVDTCETMVDDVSKPTIFVAPRDNMTVPIALVKFCRA